jgi:hypothetical protein
MCALTKGLDKEVIEVLLTKADVNAEDVVTNIIFLLMCRQLILPPSATYYTKLRYAWHKSFACTKHSKCCRFKLTDLFDSSTLLT